MSITITLPDGFQFLGASFVSTVFLLFFQSTLVSKYRKSAGIAYPQVYADKAQVEASKDAIRFNCAQRAHQNTLENLPIVYVTTLLTGLKFPVIAASALGLWTISRVSYTRGYVTGDPAKVCD
ncbi:hypothetical protein HYPSUDRAFT_135445 [Hypholoma sublateritium FD-334 SS-4]|uniref:Microsomal glutathione S-transferase 3 n=1 Tax=Hypholoma sublateritium (strain FD-334 SS-4) TaxID=945553 RepID=A0A0D2P9A3_HYPSF|nr:hypothetical protein HYPSUDRAFT_135445 [Hypholoma sublateritium FD-334 SS-4]